jgi:hypothetical protein
MKKLLAYFFLCLTLISSVNVMVDMHLCKGQVKSYAFFKAAKKCFGYFEAVEMALSNAASQQDAVTRKSCCSSALIQVEAQELKNDHFSDHLVFSGATPDLLSVCFTSSAKPTEDIVFCDVSFKEKIPETHLWKEWENFRL